jgi:glucan phosphoethanolaminetransferase (alkaline phosphatase superfamily)
MKDKTLKTIEDNIVKYIMLFLTVFLLVNNLLSTYTPYGFKEANEFVTGPFYNFISLKEGTLITIAAVFIGIYFTVFSILGSIKIESTFARLTKDNFSRLIKFIFFAFLAAFLYLFFVLIAPLLSQYFEQISQIISIVSSVLLLYMFLTSLRFGTIIYLIFKKDLKQIYILLEKEKELKSANELLMGRLDAFLKKNEEIDRQQDALITKNMLQERKHKE